MIVLAGDIGATNSRLALYRDHQLLFDSTYSSTENPSLEAVVKMFLEKARAALGSEARPERACVAVAGLIERGPSGDKAHITNLTWHVDTSQLAAVMGIPSVRLVNDFEASATGVMLLGPEHLVGLGGGPRNPTGPVLVLGPGTGLGQAFLVWSPAEQRYQVIASEGGHTDFAARTPLEHGLAAFLAGRHKRATWERVLSGPGLRDVFAFLLEEPSGRAQVTAEPRAALATEDHAAVIGRQAVAGRDPLCLMAVNLFLSVLGAQAGNLALLVLTTGGVFITGGIAPRLLPLLPRSPLREAFEAKGRFQPFLAGIPIHVVTHPQVGLLGAAALALR